MALLTSLTSVLLAPGRLAAANLPRPGRWLEAVEPERLDGRRACVRDGRALIEVRRAGRAGSAAAGDHVAQALEELAGVRWARVNWPLERVIVGLETGRAPSLAEMVAVVTRAESECLAPEQAAAHAAARGAGPDHASGSPVDRSAVDRAGLALAANGAGLALSVAGTALRLARVPAELASAVTVIDSQPRLRRSVEAVAGQPAAELGLAVMSALGQGLAGGWAGLTVDFAHRLGRLGEAVAARGAWCAREAQLLDGPDRAQASPVVTERPRPLPPGPVETYADQSVLFGIGVFGLTAAATSAPRRAVNLSLATVPKAARFGREGFAGGLGRLLARRGAVVMDAAALRRLDRVDTVLLDADVLVTGRLMAGRAVALAGARPEQVAGHLHELFQAADAFAVRQRNGWALGPVDQLRLQGRRGVPEQQRLLRGGAAGVLGLAEGERLMAVVEVAAEQVDSVDTLAAACHHAGTRLIVAGPPRATWRSLADAVVPGEGRLLGSVRALQADGAVVLLVSRRRDALGHADVGIGIDGADGLPPWGADVLAGADLETAAVVIDSCGAAARISRQAVALAQAGSVLGGVGALAGRGRGGSGTAQSAMLGVNAAAGVAFAQGNWAAWQVGRTPLVPPISRVPWHAMPADVVLTRLATTAGGLTRAEAVRRRRPPGPDLERPSLAHAVVQELNNPLTPILAGGAALSAAVGSAVDAGLVAGVSALSAVVGGVQRLRTDQAVAGLMAGSAVQARVVRDGTQLTLPADQIAPGDVLEVRSGEVIPADCRVLQAAGLQADESTLTGEAFPVTKQPAAVVASTVAERASMLYEGTTVAAGHGRAVVVATGESTEAGRSMAATHGAAPPTGVEARLAAITSTTLPVAIGSAGAVAAAGLLRGRPLRDTLGAGVSLAVASVPEGLPFLVSAAQLASARRLSGYGALVRNPRTIEALGRVDTLCFDKTGTLTQGRITLDAVADGGATTVPLRDLGDQQRHTLAAGLRATPPRRDVQPLPHLTDRAVTEGAESAGVTRKHQLPGWRRLAALPFEPSRGFHATLGRTAEAAVLSVKGAPETVFPRCTKVCTGGRDITLGQAEQARLKRHLEQLASQGYRVLAVAQRPDRPRGRITEEEEVTGLTLLGFLALSDPVRPAAGASITALREAGVQIMMITGDHPATARTVAERLGVLNGSRVITGPELDALDDPELDAVLPQVSVVARGSPAHKVRVVQAFQRLNRTVAMTGDGANDAPAIRLADIGIALGRRATPAARAAADLVVTDDRLETIISALVEGRGMWASVREALGILVGGNLGEIGFTVLGSALTGQSPLSARQLLLVNLLTDLAPAMAIALRPPSAAVTSTLLAEGPEASLGAALTRDITQRAVTTAGAATVAWAAARITGRRRRARTVALAALVGSQLGQTLVTGGPSPAVLASSVGSAVALAAVIQTPGLSQFFDCTPLGPVGWTIAGSAAAAATVAGPLVAQLCSYWPVTCGLDR